MLDGDIAEVLYDSTTIRMRTAELAKQIAVDYQGKFPIMVCILKGAVHFFSDLTRRMDIHLEMDFMIVSSFHGGTKSTGSLEIERDVQANIENRHVILVEDIVDSALTMVQLTRILRKRNPASLKVCTLCDKVEGRKFEFEPDYVGFTIPNRFIVGFGLDYQQKYRNLPYIGVLKPSVYSGDAPIDILNRE
jgi:hypoxanthine phosphoribosyltransferase